MTETITTRHPSAQTGMPRHPTGPLMSLIITLLSPMFLGVSGGDIRYARMAAIETVNAYRVRNHAELIAGAQIIAFGLAALGSLSLSMADDLSLSMTLLLRSNANACNRSAEQNRRALRQSHEAGPTPQHQAAEPEDPEYDISPEPEPEPEAFLSEAAERELAAEALARLQDPEQTVLPIPTPLQPPDTSAKKRHQEMWAIAMVKEASEINKSLSNLPPGERHAASIQAAALGKAANDLLYGNADSAKTIIENNDIGNPIAP